MNRAEFSSCGEAVSSCSCEQPWWRTELDLSCGKSFDDRSAPSKLWVNPPETLVIRAGAAIIVMGDIKNIHEARREAK